MSNRILFVLGVVALALSGCGGAKSASGSSDDPSVSIQTTASTVAYGSPVTVTWSSSNATSISSNFGAGSSQLSGSFTDTPASDTTYTVTAGAMFKPDATRSVSVRVTKSAKRILLVADTTQSWVATMRQRLQDTTTTAVTVSLTLPNSFSTDVLVLSSSGSLSPADWPKVQSFLAGGGGVIIHGSATKLLATGDRNNSNVSAIGNVLAGVTRIEDRISYDNVVTSAQPGFSLSSTLYGQSVFNINLVSPVSVDAVRLTQGVSGDYLAFVYRPSGGGRIAYLGAIGIDASSNAVASQQLLMAMTRWVAG